jgi:uncharacterized protein (TIGR03435 family)
MRPQFPMNIATRCAQRIPCLERLRRTIVALCLAGLLAAQVPAAFDAVSIHPNTSGLRVSGERNSPGRLVFSNTTTMRLIQLAYSVQRHTVIGPDSLASDRYDITATVAAPLTRAQMLPMLQGLLADRLALRSHIETRTLPAYALRVAKGRPKLQPASANVKCDPPGARGLAEITGEFDMTRLADTLAGAVDLPVIDATGLSGAYSVCLGFAPNSATPGADTSAPDMFDALREQLGLYLAPEKAAVKVLVIDHIERATPN